MNITEMVSSIRANVSSVSSVLSLCKTGVENLGRIVEELRDYNDNLRSIIRKPIDTDVFSKFNKEDVPNITVSDERYVEIISSAVKKKTLLDRMKVYGELIKILMVDLRSVCSKYDKITERIKLQDPHSSEYNIAVKKRVVLEDTLRSVAYRIKYCMRKMCETRLSLLKRIYGISQIAYNYMGDVSFSDSLTKYDIHTILSDMIKLDKKYTEVSK